MKRIIFAVHGFRTYGGWQHELKKAIEQHRSTLFDEADDVEVVSYDYGYFGFPQFFSPKRRKQAVEAWKNILVAHWPTDGTPVEIDVFAHSFGTYLVLNALTSDDLPDGFRVRNVVFASSALPPEAYSKAFALLKLRVGRLVNDCGIRDGALIATLLVYGTGMAGRVGLHGPKGSRLVNRFFNVNHSGYFDRPARDPSSHFAQFWLPVLQPDAELAPHDSRPKTPSLIDRIISTVGQHGGRASLSLYSAVLIGVFATITVLWQNAERANAIAQQKAKEAQIEGLRAKAEQNYARALYNRVVVARKDLLPARPSMDDYLKYVQSGIEVFERRAKESLRQSEAIRDGVSPPAGIDGSAARQGAACSASRFAVDMLAANYGVSLLVRWASSGKNRLILYGGGAPKTWKGSLQPRLRTLASESPSGGPVVVGTIIVPQADFGYVKGIYDLLDHMNDAAEERREAGFSIGNIWYNSFFRYGPISEDVSRARRGWRIPRFASLLEIPLNFPFDYFVASTDNGLARLDLGEDASMTVLGPTNTHLEKLGQRAVKRLERTGSNYPRAIIDELIGQVDAVNAGYTSPDISLIRAPSDYVLDVRGTDRSIVNLASMVLLFEVAGCTLLLPADANWEQILEGLRAAGLVRPNKPFTVDALLVPHHGSDRNVSEAFFRQVKARHYLFFGDGRHGNPERRTFEWLFAARPQAHLNLHFANPVETIAARRKKAWSKRKPWDEKSMGLRAFFDSQRKLGRSFTLHERQALTHLEVVIGGEGE